MSVLVVTEPVARIVVDGDQPVRFVVVADQGPSGPPGSTKIDIPLFFGGALGANELLAQFKLTSPVTLDLAASEALAESAPTGAPAIAFTLDGTPAFSIGWSAGDGAADLSALPAVLQPGWWRVRAPASPDPTFATVAITLAGARASDQP